MYDILINATNVQVHCGTSFCSCKTGIHYVHVNKGRFKASLVDSERYFLVVSRYIELNPVRAKMVTHPSHYTWSSFQFNGEMKPIKLIKPHDLYLALGATPCLRAQNYISLFDTEIPDFKIEEIRCAVNSTRVLGNEVFKRQIEQQTGLTLIPKPWGGDRRSR
jgi:putative transposase